jgi:hypothetical protein
LWCYFVYLGRTKLAHYQGFFLGALDDPFVRSGQFRGQKGLGPLKKSVENGPLCVLPTKKVIFRILRIGGALLVKIHNVG